MNNADATEILRAYRQKLTNSVSNKLDSDIQAFDMAINALKAIEEIIDYLHDSSVTWRDITDDIIADIVNKHMGGQA